MVELIEPAPLFAGANQKLITMQLTRESLTNETSALALTIPDRFRTRSITREQAVKEVCVLGKIISQGANQIGRAYLRIADTIREFKLSDLEVREALKGTFPDPRISEILRVANSPQEIYHRWQTGFFGFKAALKECRYYKITPPARLVAKQKQRAAARLASLVTEDEEIRIHNWIVNIKRL